MLICSDIGGVVGCGWQGGGIGVVATAAGASLDHKAAALCSTGINKQQQQKQLQQHLQSVAGRQQQQPAA